MVCRRHTDAADGCGVRISRPGAIGNVLRARVGHAGRASHKRVPVETVHCDLAPDYVAALITLISDLFDA